MHSATAATAVAAAALLAAVFLAMAVSTSLRPHQSELQVLQAREERAVFKGAVRTAPLRLGCILARKSTNFPGKIFEKLFFEPPRLRVTPRHSGYE